MTLIFKTFFVDYICENEKKNIVCPGGKIKIQKAIFGRTEARRCARGNDFYCVIDVTDKIKKLCQDKESCLVVSSKEYLNIRFHPCFRYSKYLRISRTCKSDGKIFIQIHLFKIVSLLKKRLRHICFPEVFTKVLRTSCWQSTTRGTAF